MAISSIPFGRIKVDSLKIIIPFSEVTVLDGKFNQEYIETKFYQATGEVLQSINRDIKVFSTQKGIKVKLEVFKIKYARIKEKGYSGEEYLVFQPSSKFLKEIYFDGINFHNLPTIYDYLISLNIVRFTYESLLNARFKDVDFCIDFLIDIEEFKLINKNIEFNVLEKSKHFVKQFNNYSGLQFNEREKATPTKPFCKFYHKSTELINNSTDFYNEYLKQDYSDLINKGIGRYEITIKDAKFKKRYKIESVTVNELFNIPYDSIQSMFKKILPNYLYKNTKEKKMTGTPTEIIHFNTINYLIEYGASEQEILNRLLKGIDEKKAKSRSKKMLQELFNKVENPIKLEQNNEEKKVQNEIYTSIGFYDSEI